MSPEAIIIGSVTGFISAFFGIGGSSIDTPLLRTFLHLPPYIALGTPLPLTIVTAAIASFTYKREHLVNYRTAVYSLMGGVPGMIAGSYLTAYLSGTFLMLFTAVVLCFIGIGFMFKNALEKTFCKNGSCLPPSPSFIIFVATIIGVLSGVLANGGGIFFVPAYIILFHMKIKEAIATSLLTVAVLSLPGSIIHYHLGHVDLAVTASIGIGVIPMAYAGARLDMKTDSKTLASLFGIFLIIFSVYFFISHLNG